MGWCLSRWGCFARASLDGGSAAQGFIVDRRPAIPVGRSYEIREVSIDARVRDQVAEVQISQTFHNPGSVQIESEFLFPLPEDGAVQNFVLLVDGRELPGRLMNKDEARRIYEEIVRSKRDPALLEYMGRGLYRTSVFPIPPGGPEGDDAVHPALQARPRRPRVLLSAQYAEVHRQADPAAVGEHLAPEQRTPSSRSTAPATTPGSTGSATMRRGSAWSGATSFRATTSGWFTP